MQKSSFLLIFSTLTIGFHLMLLDYMASNISGSWPWPEKPWPFRVTWRHRSRDHWNHTWSFHIGGLLTPSHYLAWLMRYYVP